jgi:N-acetylmuramoyl-L-alanine amidase
LVLEGEKMHRFNRFYLLATLVISIIIPFLSFEIIQIVPVAENLQTSSFEAFPTVINSNINQETVIPIPEAINYTPYIIWSLYFLIMALLFARFFKNCLVLISKSKSNPIVKYKNANLVLIDEKILPHTFLNSVFVNFNDYNEQNIEDELYTHELVHVTQKHTLDILFIELLKCFFWFSPLFYFYKKAIQLNHEFLADEEIVKTYNNVPFYQNLLLQKSSNVQTIYLASNLNYLITKKRLLMMTKSTSKKLAIFKKIAIVPILAGLAYFFCINIVAQESVTSLNTETRSTSISDIDKIRDNYYSGIYINIHDEKSNRKEVILYEKLSLNDKRKYLDHLPEIHIEKEISETLFDLLKTKNWKIAINNRFINKEELKNYKKTDFAYYSYNMVDKSQRSKEFPKEYQYTLYTKQYFDKNMEDSHIHFKGDTIKIVFASYKTVIKEKFANSLKADTLTWYTKGKDQYNLYIKEKRNKKTIVIDAGHGGRDFGTQIDGKLESKIVESIAKKIKLLNSKNEIEIILLRDNDSFIGLKERVDAINKINPDLLISLHVNSSNNKEENGAIAYIFSENEFYKKSIKSAEILKNTFNKGEVKNGNFFIIKNSNCPAVLLELGYLSNENDKEYLTSENGKNEIANKIFNYLNK